MELHEKPSRQPTGAAGDEGEEWHAHNPYPSMERPAPEAYDDIPRDAAPTDMAEAGELEAGTAADERAQMAGEEPAVHHPKAPTDEAEAGKAPEGVHDAADLGAAEKARQASVDKAFEQAKEAHE